MDIIKDFMSTPVLCVNSDATEEEAAKEIVEKKVSCLLVKENEEPVGLITTTDLVKKLWLRDWIPKPLK